jgi:hypothetical protein
MAAFGPGWKPALLTSKPETEAFRAARFRLTSLPRKIYHYRVRSEQGVSPGRCGWSVAEVPRESRLFPFLGRTARAVTLKTH